MILKKFIPKIHWIQEFKYTGQWTFLESEAELKNLEHTVETRTQRRKDKEERRRKWIVEAAKEGDSNVKMG